MRIHLGDSVIRRQGPSGVGIVERRQGDTLTMRFPDQENRREQASRREVCALAEVMYEARERGDEVWKNLSLVGGSTPANLFAFGYATRRLRSESRDCMVRQLQRAGFEVHPETGRWDRDDRFKLILTSIVSPDTLYRPDLEQWTGVFLRRTS
jgi:hypothetical protein